MSNTSKRKCLPPKLYKEVLERDEYQCQKCGRGEDLELHHIIPVAVCSMDIAENLITLCTTCHSEWEHVIYGNVKGVSFEAWLELPTCPELLLILTNKKLWDDNTVVSMKELRKTLIHAHRIWRTTYSDPFAGNTMEVTGMSRAELYRHRKALNNGKHSNDGESKKEEGK